MRQYCNENWYFTPVWAPGLCDTAGLTPVRLPHTVRELPLHYADERDYQMEAGYLHFLDAPAEWAGKSVTFTLGAAAHEAEIFLNGVSLGVHRCGYTAFSVELSPHLVCGARNTLAVRLDTRETLDQPPFGYAIDYMTFGGLYRGAWLEVRDRKHFVNVFAHGGTDGVLHLQCAVAGGLEDCQISATVLGEGGGPVEALAGQRGTGLSVPVPGAKLWSVEAPNLYTARLRLCRGDQLLDETEVRFGFRTVEFRADGFYLNGQKLLLRGLNRHQSWPYLGYAVPDRAQALDAEILKYELGCNAVRTSHYPQSHAFIDRCDELGLLVFTEIPGWQHIGGAGWKDQALRNTAEMIVQYRNHPSIFIWGVRINESQDDDGLYAQTNAVAHRLDPTRPTGGVRNFKKSHLLEDVYTYNDFLHSGQNAGCDPKRAVTPDLARGYLVTEYNGHMYPTKSFDCEAHRTEHALRHAAVLAGVAAQPDIAGSFGWCMFDYNTHRDFGSGDRICYHGVMDAFRNAKPAAAVYAAQGLDPAQRPVLEISSAMDIGEHPACNLGDIWAFTNADQVALYKNDARIAVFDAPGGKGLPHPPICIDDTIGELLEKQEGYDAKTAARVKTVLKGVAEGGPAGMPPKALATAAWLMAAKHFTYETGVALYGKYVANWGRRAPRWRFVALRAGKPVAEVVKEPVEAVRLEARPDTCALADGPTWDMATIRLRALDQNGNVLPYFDRAVCLETAGPVELVGPRCITLQGGMGGTYLRTTGAAGDATLTLRADGLAPVTLQFTVNKGEA